MFYFKDKDEGIGMTTSKKDVGDNLVWITKEEYNEILIANLEKERLLREETEDVLSE